MPYSNRAEADFASWAIDQGWSVTKRGWPDFICRRGAELMCVEVKDSTGLSPEQCATIADLVAHGIPTFVWWTAKLTADGVDPGHKLEPASELTRLLSDEELTAIQAAKRLAGALDLERATVANLDRRLRKLGDRMEAVIVERKEERAGRERLMGDLGYLLRQVQDYQRGRDGRYSYTSRMKRIVRRYPQLAWAEVPYSGELQALLQGAEGGGQPGLQQEGDGGENHRGEEVNHDQTIADSRLDQASVACSARAVRQLSTGAES